MDWKWFFIYPEQGIATVNEIAFPANVPVHFKVTSNSVMNSFFIPRLGSQIYAMAGMQTQLHLIADEAGTYDGISASYSGPGFSGMKFKAIATPDRADFRSVGCKSQTVSELHGLHGRVRESGCA
ncbi:cytochrome o ubiquinol oxidase subunit II [Klebsiella pneumoniae]|uniref:Cytochrome o ubiquinol oxidase subunit II n=1 Tax=Klebsiella pneumoniae TaxID=573 RepID=A0A378CDX6_KLEPN|nr:cytochrome o ubiquinol oxidase subunit II [Klebsiella pneumoniae]